MPHTDTTPRTYPQQRPTLVSHDAAAPLAPPDPRVLRVLSMVNVSAAVASVIANHAFDVSDRWGRA